MSALNLTQLIRPSGLFVAGAALVLVVCADDSSAGIQGTGKMSLLASVGPITSTGSGGTSISVNGVAYGLSKAKVQIDGHNGGGSQLHVGQIVAVQGTLNGAGKGDASSVTFTGNVVGPITQVDVAAGTFTVLGQTVSVDATTLFGDGIQPAGIGALGVGTAVEVSGFATASGGLLASRVDLQTAGSPLQVQGTVEALNSGAQTFQINSLTVDYGQATVSGTLANASTATVTANEYASAGTLHAATVNVGNTAGGMPGEHGQLEGLVTSMVSASAFYVGDQLVVTNSGTHVELQGKALAPNLAVKVGGVFDASGALVASQLHLDPRTP